MWRVVELPLWVFLVVWYGIGGYKYAKVCQGVLADPGRVVLVDSGGVDYDSEDYVFWGATSDDQILLTEKDPGDPVKSRRLSRLGGQNTTFPAKYKQFNSHKHRGTKALVVTALENIDPYALYRSVGVPRVSELRFRVASYAGVENNSLVLKFKTVADANFTLELLKTSPDVLFVDYVRKYTVNRAFALGLCTGIGRPGPLNGMDLSRGHETVLAIADTGLDASHAYFSDTVPFPRYVASRENIGLLPEYFKHFGHKKIHGYVALRYKDLESGNFVETDFVDDADGHGTHVAGIAAGFSPDFPVADSKTRVLFFDLEGKTTENGAVDVPDSMWWMLQLAYNSGSRIFTNSWGSPGCDYTSYAFEVDMFVFKHPDMTVVFSAGNMGPDRCTIGSPAVAKNVLAVGSSFNAYESWYNYSRDNQIWDNYSNYHIDPEDVVRRPELYNEHILSRFSSRGPTSDGRIKPEIVVPGEWIKSARAGTKKGELLMRGTSQAAPVAAHLLTIVDEKLRTVFGVANPMASLRRAILVACATPMTNSESIGEAVSASSHTLFLVNRTSVVPALDDGFGQVSIAPFLQGKLAFLNTLSLSFMDGSSWKKFVFVFNGKSARESVVVLSYTDVPSVSYGRLLVNDISTRVVVLRRGNVVFAGNGNGAIGYGDSLNPTERVRFYVEPGDEVHVTIGAMHNIGTSKQEVSLVYSSDLKLSTGKIPRCTEYDLPRHCGGKSDIYMKCLPSGSFDPESCLVREKFATCTTISLCEGGFYTKCGDGVVCQHRLRYAKARRSLLAGPDRYNHADRRFLYYSAAVFALACLFMGFVTANDMERRYAVYEDWRKGSGSTVEGGEDS